MSRLERVGVALLCAFVLYVAWIVVCPYFAIHCVVSTGDRVGVVTKLSQRGVFWKTWEASAMIGSTATPGIGSEWDFTIDADGPVDDVRRAMESGDLVQMSYVQYYSGGMANGDTSYRVKSVKAKEARK